jgi:hypothetical protein
VPLAVNVVLEKAMGYRPTERYYLITNFSEAFSQSLAVAGPPVSRMGGNGTHQAGIVDWEPKKPDRSQQKTSISTKGLRFLWVVLALVVTAALVLGVFGYKTITDNQQALIATATANAQAAAAAANAQADATADTQTRLALAIKNPGFEMGTLDGWMNGGSVSIDRNSHSGNFAARIGSTSANYYESFISQTFQAPVGASALSFWYQVVCYDRNRDYSGAVVVDNRTDAQYIALGNTCTNTGQWIQARDPNIIPGDFYTLKVFTDISFGGDNAYILCDDVTLS